MRRNKLRFSRSKHPYYKVVYPTNIDFDYIIDGWWIKDEPSGFMTTPDPCSLSTCGYIQVFLCALIFWPCSCLPCFLSDNYNGYQTPNIVKVKNSNTIPIAIPIATSITK